MENTAISNVSNYIGQKLFAYISNGSDINDNIKEKFKKSLIFIGDEGQIYNPLTNTYIGIGQTSYTGLLTYIKSAHDKINALNTALTSSLVSGIYANWGKEEWEELLENDSDSNFKLPEGVTSEELRESKQKGDLNSIFATNDIIIKGNGNYDIETKLRKTYETANVVDENLIGSSQEICTGSAYVYSGNYSAFADSGITVSLEKGKNRYRYTYTDGEGEEHEIWITDDEAISYSDYTRWSDDDNPNGIFKNGRNVLSIDDKMTWAYIANSYSYTLSFARQYTNHEINRIYSEILGIAEPRLIPVAVSTAKEQVLNGDLEISYEGINGTTSKFELNKDTIYLRRVLIDSSTGKSTAIEKPVTADSYTYVYIQGETQTVKVYPYSEYTNLEWGTTVIDGETVDCIIYTNSKDPSIKEYIIDNYGTTTTPDGKKVYFFDYDTDKDGNRYDPEGDADDDPIEKDENGAIIGRKDYYNNPYIYTPVVNIDVFDTPDTYVYVVNDDAINNSNFNLADGINTFKEVAYILDAITNGLSGDVGEDGITLAYNIAYNYRWNQAQDERIQAIEDGTNVVSALSSDHNNKYIDTRITSSLVYTPQKNSEGTDVYVENTLGDNELFNISGAGKKEYFARVNKNEIISYVKILDSELSAYNTALKSYYDDTDKAIARPTLSDFITYTSSDEPVENLWTTTLQNTANSDGVSYSYVGEVDFSIDLKLASTYVNHDYQHDDTTGFELVNYNDLIYKATCTVYVPEEISQNTKGTEVTDTARHKTVPEKFADLNANEKNIVLEALKSYGIIPESETVATFDEKAYEDTLSFAYQLSSNGSVKTEITFVINPTQSTSRYDGKVYDSEFTPITTANNTFNERTIDYQKFYLRLKPEVSKHADTTTSGLVDVDWINTFINDNNAKIFENVKEALITSYEYTDKAINRLNTSTYVSPSEYVSSVTQENGIVTVNGKELPTDNIYANYEVWGNGTKTYKKYDIVIKSGDDTGYFSQFDHNSPLYIIDNTKPTYVMVDSSKTYLATDLTGTKDKEEQLNGKDLYRYNHSTNNYELLTSEDHAIVYNSLVIGREAVNFTQLYTKTDTYVRIDPADIVIENGKVMHNGIEITDTNPIYVEDEKPTNSVNYITATSAHHSAENGGDGANTFGITAHITKLIDANVDNTGLVDAYDVRNTLDNLFEWVDLSEWSAERENVFNKVGPDSKAEADANKPAEDEDTDD